MGAGAGGAGTDDFLGTEMYWSNWDAETNVGLVAAGFDVMSADEHTEDEDGAAVTHLWVVARRL